MPQHTSEYDHHFKIYADIYFGADVSWQWFKAMGIVESSLTPKAVSYAGAKGIMQLMPETSAQVARELWIIDDPFDPKINILMGIHYARKMWNIFKNEEGLDRLCFMLGAYNAGSGNIVKAQKKTTHPEEWQHIVSVLPLVTGPHAMETIDYVNRVLEVRQQLL